MILLKQFHDIVMPNYSDLGTRNLFILAPVCPKVTMAQKNIKTGSHLLEVTGKISRRNTHMCVRGLVYECSCLRLLYNARCEEKLS